jgi:hypothetical protein
MEGPRRLETVVDWTRVIEKYLALIGQSPGTGHGNKNPLVKSEVTIGNEHAAAAAGALAEQVDYYQQQQVHHTNGDLGGQQGVGNGAGTSNGNGKVTDARESNV